jgi:hypothetical protein
MTIIIFCSYQSPNAEDMTGEFQKQLKVKESICISSLPPKKRFLALPEPRRWPMETMDFSPVTPVEEEIEKIKTRGAGIKIGRE